MTLNCALLSQSLCSGSSPIGCPDSYLPGPLFFSDQDMNFISGINFELIKNVAGQWIIYYRIDERRTTLNLYGESKIKNFFAPVKVWTRCEFLDPEQTTTNFTLDENRKVNVFFNRQMLTKINLKVTVGDFLSFGDTTYEIDKVTTLQPVHGIPFSMIEVKAECHRSRETQFNAE